MIRPRERGFALLVAILLGAMILVGVVGALHLGARRLDAERTEATRRALPEAFRGIFPYAVDQPGNATIPNLLTDFAYFPDAPTVLQRAGDLTPSWDLSGLVERSQVGTSDGAFTTPPAAFDGTNAGAAWNGPYWRGAKDGLGRPVDAWGRFFELRTVTTPSAGWILHSAGANGKDDTPALSGTPGGDDLIYPSPPYVPPTPPVASTTFTASMFFVLLLQDPSPCGGGNNVFLTVVLTYDDGTGTKNLTTFSNYQMHRKGSGKPNVATDLFRTLTLKSSPSGAPASLAIAVTGGCPDTLLNPVAFQPPSSSGLIYLGSSTSGATTTYSFSVNHVAPPSTAVPWPITIQP